MRINKQALEVELSGIRDILHELDKVEYRKLNSKQLSEYYAKIREKFSRKQEIEHILALLEDGE